MNIDTFSMREFITVMKALSDSNRVRIIKMLQHRSLCVCEIQALLRIAQPSVSKHLKILENAGFVESKKEGLWVNYYLKDGRDSPYVANILGNLRHWLENDREIIDIVKKLPDVHREKLGRR